MGDIKEALTASADSSKGIAGACILDAIIILIVAIYDICMGHSIGSLGTGASGAIVIVIGLLFFVTAFLLLKGKIVGYYLAWVMAAASIIYWLLPTILSTSSNMTFKIYFLLTGVILAIYLILPKSREDLS